MLVVTVTFSVAVTRMNASPNNVKIENSGESFIPACQAQYPYANIEGTMTPPGSHIPNTMRVVYLGRNWLGLSKEWTSTKSCFGVYSCNNVLTHVRAGLGQKIDVGYWAPLMDPVKIHESYCWLRPEPL